MAVDGRLNFEVDYDTKTATKNLKSLGKLLVATFSVKLIADFTKEVIDMGKEVAKVERKFSKVFDGMTESVEDWASEFAYSFGETETDIKGMLSNIGDLTQGLGMTKEESFALGQEVLDLGKDLSALNGIPLEDTVNRITKAMLGEAEAAKEIGLLLNVDRVKEYAEANGLVWENVTDAQKAQLALNLAIEQSPNALGQADAFMETYEGKLKRVTSAMDEIKEKIGIALLPAMERLVDYLLNGGGIEAIEKLALAFIDEGIPAIEEFIELLTKNGGLFDTLMGAVEWLSDTKDGVSNLQQVIDIFTWGAILKGAETLVGIFGSLVTSIGFFGLSWGLMIQEGIENWDWFVYEVQYLFTDMVNGVITLVNGLIYGMVKGIEGGINAILGHINILVDQLNGVIEIINRVSGMNIDKIKRLSVDLTSGFVGSPTLDMPKTPGVSNTIKPTPDTTKFSASNGGASMGAPVYVQNIIDGRLISESTKVYQSGGVRFGGGDLAFY